MNTVHPNVAASVRARLLNVAKAQGVDFNQVLVPSWIGCDRPWHPQGARPLSTEVNDMKAEYDFSKMKARKNPYHSRLKRWMRRFHGVATKYLGHYLSWRRMLEHYPQAMSPALCLHQAIGRTSQHVIST